MSSGGGEGRAGDTGSAAREPARPELASRPVGRGSFRTGEVRAQARILSTMGASRDSLGLMLATMILLAAGGALWAAELPGAEAAWALAGVLPLPGLAARIVGDLRRRRPGVDLIALLAIGGSLALGEFLTAAIIGLMLATGRFLEAFAAGRAERALTALVERAPREAHLSRGGRVESVPIEDVASGDRLLVKAGEVVPVDGIIVTPLALLDESALTGESAPVQRATGDRVSSGVVNAAGAFEMRAVAGAEESTYAGIIRLVRQARESRATVVRLADRWAGWFVLVTMAAAGLAWAVFADPMRALAVLVVATPCPLLLAVPVAIVSGISREARRGIIVRGGDHLETLARTENVLLDKTGTLTAGVPTLRSVVAFDGALGEGEALRLAASLEQGSTHILARAVVAEARRRNLRLSFPVGVTESPGGGVSGDVEGIHVAVGKAGWLLGGDPEPLAVSRFRRRAARVAPLTLFIAVDGGIVAGATFDDTIRSDAAATIRALRRAGVKRVVIATGDHPVVAESVGLALGVDMVLAERSPADKVEVVRNLREEGITVMVGDGINDAPALAAADVGVAMGARGATASSEAAGVVLMVDRLSRLVDGIQIARHVRQIAVQSVVIGMGLSLAAMGVAWVGLLPPIAGAITQEVIDVIAIGNALRALTGRIDVESKPKLPPELTRHLRAEHDLLIPRLDLLREVAGRLERLPPATALAELREVRRFAVEEILPHELEDEREIYRVLAGFLGGEDPLASMSRSHREIFHLVHLYDRVLADLPAAGPEPGDMPDLLRLLYGLHAILRLHFDQEEELYSSLDEAYQPGPRDVPVASPR